MIIRLGVALVQVAVAALLVFGPSSASAETYPTRPIRLVVPYSAGSGADLAARLTASSLSAILNQSIIIENRPGTSAIVGTLSVVRSAPDGYTLLQASTQHAINPAVVNTLPYDTIADLAPVARVTSQPLFLAVSNSLPVNSVSELVAYIKQRPGELNYASTGVGTSIHLAGAYFVYKAGLKMSHVPYVNASQSMIDLGEGRVHLIFYTYIALLPQVQSGTVKILASTAPERSSWLPDVPTMIESGFPQFAMPAWQGIFAPAKTPQPVVRILEKGIAKVTSEPEFAKSLEVSGTDPFYASSEQFGKFVQSQIDGYREIVAAVGMKPE